MNLQQTLTHGRTVVRPTIRGQVMDVNGLTVWVAGLTSAIGDVVELELANRLVRAEVVAVQGGRIACMPLGDTTGIGPGVLARATKASLQVPVGHELLGRVIDATGQPLDGGPRLDLLPHVSVTNDVPPPMSRQRINQQLHMGVRAIDGMIPIGRGQRMGIFAGSGVGKSTLMSMMARNTSADVVVVGLIGERGREVREFIENDLGPEGLARSVVVVATSDAPPMMRLRAAFATTRIAEWFRDQGLDVLLFMDSITRTMMAQREVGLSAGEPPATRAYPPSAFAMLPRLLERAGPAEIGTITGIYTVLLEGDDIQDPIGDTARSILDGHIVLDRDLAHANHYPAIDVLGSISRVAPAISTPEVIGAAGQVRKLLAAHREARILLEVGAYVPGTNGDVDRARALMPSIDSFLRQGVHETSTLEETQARLMSLAGGL
jgi:flagellum-specific ATP synthase